MADFIEQIYNKGSISGGQIAKRKVGVVLPKISAYPAFLIFFTYVTLIIFLKIKFLTSCRC